MTRNLSIAQYISLFHCAKLENRAIEAVDSIRKVAKIKVTLADQDRFVEAVELNLMGLHEGNC